MTESKACPFCNSPDIRELAGMSGESLVLPDPGAEARAIEISYYRCIECGQEVEGEFK